MAQIYAGILGSLAMLTCVMHGAIHAKQPEATVFSAWLALIVFAGIGCIVGRIAEHTVEESVKSLITTELEAEELARNVASQGETG